MAWRAEHGDPGASIPSVIQITVESESQIIEDVPGVEIDADALENAPDQPESETEATVREQSEKPE